MNAVLSWLQMGGYSFYVWPAYSVLCVVCVMHILGMKWHRKTTFKKLQQWFRRQ